MNTICITILAAFLAVGTAVSLAGCATPKPEPTSPDPRRCWDTAPCRADGRPL